MVSTWILALALFSGAVSAVPTSKQGRVIGGEPTRIEEYPSMVQVDFLFAYNGQWAQQCAGSILNVRNVISVAHCFHGISFFGAESRRIRAGATYTDIGGVIYYVERITNHPEFERLGSEGDLSILRLSSPIVYSQFIQRASIVMQGAVVPDNVPIVNAGWGTLEQCGAASDVLRDVTVYTINNRLCAERFATLPNQPTVTEKMVCVGILDVGGKGPCQGDSGSPLYYAGIVIGVVSGGLPCGNETFPSTGAAIGSYSDWIVANAV